MDFWERYPVKKIEEKRNSFSTIKHYSGKQIDQWNVKSITNFDGQNILTINFMLNLLLPKMKEIQNQEPRGVAPGEGLPRLCPYRVLRKYDSLVFMVQWLFCKIVSFIIFY